MKYLVEAIEMRDDELSVSTCDIRTARPNQYYPVVTLRGLGPMSTDLYDLITKGEVYIVPAEDKAAVETEVEYIPLEEEPY